MGSGIFLNLARLLTITATATSLADSLAPGQKKNTAASSPRMRSTLSATRRSNVLPLKGEIDLHVSPSVTASLNEMINKKPERMVVDLSDVSYIDSAGLAALIEAMQKVEGYGGKFMLAGLQETVRSIFEIS